MALADFLKTINQTGGVNPQQSPIGQSNPSMQTSSTPSPFGDMSQKLEGKNDKLKLMLYALGGALKGDKDFVQNTLALQQMQEGKKKQEAQKQKYQDFLAKLPEGSFKDLATALGPSKLDDLLLERYKAETKGIDDTARQREYSQLQSILEDPNKTPEEKDLAKKFFAGITGGKSKEQTIRELVASLAKTINPYTQQLYTPDEISAQIQQIDPLLSGTYGQQSPQPAPGSFGYKKYKVTPEG